MSIQNCNRVINHHIQQEYCTTRPAYRQGKKLTAVKVYTVNNESQHLYIYGVPQVNLRKELKHLCSKYGDIVSVTKVSDVETEIFTECFHVLYKRIQSARIAKRLIDTRSFYGGILHVCYASECETVEETRMKLAQRRRDVHNRLPK
ncbi:RNA-binding protein 48 isoform X1 [Euwallacea fornicatus]|uniref:RNA-binding protein 48 isoform X1 n=1 Tax=Euwallacea fornicatus TaxID=995702 RepID=UPI00338FBBB0